jgi:putative oxidoreductase
MESWLSKQGAWAPVVLRVVIGIIFAVHGYQKLALMGVGNVAEFFGGAGIPLPLVSDWIVTLVELLGGIALILGLYTRWVSIPLAIIMLVALLMVHVPNGFFVSEGGFEFVFILLAGLVALAFLGAGPFSLDQQLKRA